MDNQREKRETRCVIYDCDGVLFDSLEANSKLYNDLCSAVGRIPLQEEEVEYVHTHTVFQAVHFIFEKYDGLEQKALDLLKRTELGDYVVYLKMEPNLLETLSRLKERGIIRVINTNRTTSMKHVMNRFGLWPFFDMVVTALDVKNSKPHPESVEKILRAFNLEPGDALFIGDSELDQQAAASAGVKFVAYKNKDLPRDAYIADHLELFNVISDGNPCK